MWTVRGPGEYPGTVVGEGPVGLSEGDGPEGTYVRITGKTKQGAGGGRKNFTLTVC